MEPTFQLGDVVRCANRRDGTRDMTVVEIRHSRIREGLAIRVREDLDHTVHPMFTWWRPEELEHVEEPRHV